MSGKVKAASSEVVAQYPLEYRAKWDQLPCCLGCGRRVRAIGELAEDWPETVLLMSQGLCGTCYTTSRRTTRHRGIGGDIELKPDGSPMTLKDYAKNWTEEQHNLAWMVCSRVDNVEEATQTMAMLGLFDDETFVTYIFGPDLGYRRIGE